MIRLEDRQVMVSHIEQAHAAGARLKRACELAGIDVRTLQRWKAGDGLVRGDGHPTRRRAIGGSCDVACACGVAADAGRPGPRVADELSRA